MNNKIHYLPPQPRAYNNQMEALYPEMILKNKYIKSITFQVTEDCCMACTYCYQHNKSKNKMSFETAKICIDNLLANKYENISIENTFGIIFDFIGGEPLLEINLIEQICDYFLNLLIDLRHPWLYFFKINICSNGLLYDTPEVQNFFKKYGKFTSFSISVDGNKELHDACRIDLNGNGTYDKIIAAVHSHKKNFGYIPLTKMTIAPENVNYIYDAVLNLIQEGYQEIPFNCVFENVWSDKKDATILYQQLKKLGNYLIDNQLYNKIWIRMFNENSYCPKLDDDANWCGGTDYFHCVSLDYCGNFYPCIRYMASSLGNKQQPIIVGDIYNNFNNTDFHQNNIAKLQGITRRSQSTDECFYCPIASGCAWCSAFNYEEFGTVNKRATYVCNMHKAEALANVYYWNTLYQYLGIDKTFEMHIPKEWALEIIDEDEYNMLYELSHKNASQL